MVNNLLDWILGIVMLFALGYGGIQKHKANKAVKAKDKIEEELAIVKVKEKVGAHASKAKDDLEKKKKENQAKEKEVIQSISDIPKEKEVPLSEDIKKAAADQSARVAARAKRLQNN